MIARKTWIACTFVTMAVLATPLAALDVPSGTLWRVEQTCMLNARTTGSAFPCLKVDFSGGYAVLRAPFRDTHIVIMPTRRVPGVEDPSLRKPDATNYFEAAWQARRFVEADAKRPLGRDDIGLAVNSLLTRSQDQLHIHVDCVDRRVKRALADRLATMPTDRWVADGFRFHGQSYWTRRLDAPDLSGVNLFALADEIPALRQSPLRTIIGVVGMRLPNGGDGFVLLAGQSIDQWAAAQSTSEDLLDHKCRRAV